MPKTVLIVEDYVPLRQVATRLLQGHGYTVVEVGSGEEALAIAADDRPDIILLDIGLPGMDGWETLTRLQAVPATAKIPVVIATAQGSTEDSTRGFALGAVDYIVKPYRIEELLAAFEAAFAWSKAGRKEGNSRHPTVAA
jgi:DNA-binding response OmpR family regulator